jgi:sugar lactone lactonase YvrE
MRARRWVDRCLTTAAPARQPDPRRPRRDELGRRRRDDVPERLGDHDDGRTLIVGETAGARYTAFTIGDDGALGDRRVWAQLAPTPELGTLEETLGQLRFGPDGCGLDAEEHIWSADEVNARCCRVAPGGEVVEEAPAPDGLDMFACMLGGEDGRTVLMCAAPDFHEQARSQAREAVLLTTRVDVPHAGLP